MFEKKSANVCQCGTEGGRDLTSGGGRMFPFCLGPLSDLSDHAGGWKQKQLSARGWKEKQLVTWLKRSK